MVSQCSVGLNATNLLVHLDPFNSNQITYSSCVTILSQIVVDNDNKSTLFVELADKYN